MSDSKSLEAQLKEMIEEALELRYGTAGDPDGTLDLPPSSSSQQDVLETLLRVRARADRLEEIYARLIRTRADGNRRFTLAKATAQEAWNDHLGQQRRASARRGGEFEGPRERYAEADLATLSQQREQRAAERLVSHIEEALDVVKLAHRSLDGFRQDVLAILRSYAFESHLER